MTEADLRRRLLATLPRDLLIDLVDMTVAEARLAFEVIRDHTPLDGKEGRAAEGQLRFRFLAKAFQRITVQHGGVLIEDGVFGPDKLRSFQTVARFGGDQPGVVLGLASMPAPRDLPNKNQSRLAGVSMNEWINPELDLDGTGERAKVGDLFVLFLFARNRAQAGRVEEMAVGVIGADYGRYLLYLRVEDALAGYAPGPSAGDGPAHQPLVRLKKSRKLFKPPEASDPGDDATGKE